MIAALLDAKRAIPGVIRMLAGDQEYRASFDVSPGGVIRSFFAAICAIPFAGFEAGVTNALARARSFEGETVLEPYSLALIAVRWLVVWAYFPFFAALVTRLVGRREHFAPWVVVHNWTHLFVVMLPAPAYLLLVTGAPGAAQPLLLVVVVVSVYAFVRAAGAALETGWRVAVMAGCANMSMLLLINAWLAQAFQALG